MTNNEPIVIERVGNGFMVRPRVEPGLPYMAADCHVFQHMGRYGGDERVRDEDTLCGWIARHFPTPDKA